MSVDYSLSELLSRLEKLENRLAAKLAEVKSRGPLPSREHREIEEIRARARAVRGKADAADGSTWDEVKHDLDADWNILNHAFERWVENIDRTFRR